MQDTITVRSDREIAVPPIPDMKTLGRLFLGGLAGLVVWEFWARVITVWVVGGPLEPPGLIISLVVTWTGYELNYEVARMLHYVVGIVGYPVAYWVISRGLRRWAPILDIAVWALFSAYLVFAVVKGFATTFMGSFWLFVTLLSLTRLINPNKLIADSLSWGSFTWFNALGIMAPLAGLPFLLLDGGDLLSFMSWAGHVIYGALAVYVYGRLSKSDG